MSRFYFNPRAPCGARLSLSLQELAELPFQSTRPVRGATSAMDKRIAHLNDFNPRAPCGARLRGLDEFSLSLQISIHAPRAGRDGEVHTAPVTYKAFQSTRPVRGATGMAADISVSGQFQSTRPVRGATLTFAKTLLTTTDFNPRAPCGARLLFWERGSEPLDISIHAPRAGRDEGDYGGPADYNYFNPRAPCGARHIHVPVLVGKCTISIHAPRAGRDKGLSAQVKELKEFQSTRPVRGATHRRRCGDPSGEFQSTRPVRGATGGYARINSRETDFNPRAPCGARPQSVAIAGVTAQFQSTRPVRGATPLGSIDHCTICGFQSTRPVRGATAERCHRRGDGTISIHAPRAGRDLVVSSNSALPGNFNPRAPCGARQRIGLRV